MRRAESVSLWFCAYATFLCAAAHAGDVNLPAANPLPEAVTMRVGAVRITNRVIELRCEIANQTGQDIWLYAPNYDLSLGKGDPCSRGCELFFMDENGPTLFVYACIDARWEERRVYGNSLGTYVRLPSREKRSEVLSCSLPFPDWRNSRVTHSLTNASRGGTDWIRRLVFAVGYYTEDDLKPWGGGSSFHREDSGNVISIFADTQARIVGAERRIETSMAGVRIPILDLLPPDETPRVLSSQQVDMIRRLFKVLLAAKAIVHRGEYFYAERLFSLDKSLFNDAAQRIADVFTQVADGRLPLEDLQTRLDEILNGPDRDKLLKELQEKQSVLDKSLSQ